MKELFASPFFGIALSVLAFLLGVKIRKKTGLELCNPLLIAIVLVSAVLLICRIPYEDYNQGGRRYQSVSFPRHRLSGGVHLHPHSAAEG